MAEPVPLRYGPIDAASLQEFRAKFSADQAAAMHLATVLLGDRLGLYGAMADGGPMTDTELAETTGYHPRLVREWLGAQTVSGYCEYDAGTGRYSLSAEQAACLADPTSTTFLAGAPLLVAGMFKDTSMLELAFGQGGGVEWGEHDPDLFIGVERLFEPIYRGNLVQNWIPALEGVSDKLLTGARVADVGCGHAASLILLAQAFPKSTFWGFDYHAGSVETARQRIMEAGLADRVHVEVAGAENFPGEDYDLICVFNALHEWGDPERGARYIREALASDGTCMLIEPNAPDRLEDNRGPVGRTFYAASTFVCVPSSLSQGSTSLGAQAGEAAIRDVVIGAGFKHLRRATETPQLMVLEARP